jgi:broad specificity phosphatase PhoE
MATAVRLARVVEARRSTRRVILAKHALPDIESGVAARHWQLGARGERQARRLARELRERLSTNPFRLVSSPEPKARRTAEIVAHELDSSVIVRNGLEELDRSVLPISSPAEYAALNAPIFAEPWRRVLGEESGDEALARFERALCAAVTETPDEADVIAVTHGTVIALFVAAHAGVDGFELWKRLRCPSFVILAWPAIALLAVVEQLD